MTFRSQNSTTLVLSLTPQIAVHLFHYIPSSHVSTLSPFAAPTVRLYFQPLYIPYLGIIPHVKQHRKLTATHRSFYHLSKTHHPDHNPSDPHASHRFMRISEAYSTLSHANKRARYDRDVLRLHLRARAHGSHHSSSVGPAGGRPASGLSKRRSTTQGAPPPSFFKQGGYGEQKVKREWQQSSTGYSSQQQYGYGGGPGPGPTGGFSWGAGGGEGATGGGPKQEYSQAFNPASAPHFNSEQHTRTHEQLWENLKKSHARRSEAARQQAQWQQQQEEEEEEGQQQWWSGSGYHQQEAQQQPYYKQQQQQWGESKKVMPEIQQGNWASFFAVTAVLLVSSFGPYWLFGEWTSTGGGGGGGGGGSGKKRSGSGGSGGSGGGSTSRKPTAV